MNMEPNPGLLSEPGLASRDSYGYIDAADGTQLSSILFSFRLLYLHALSRVVSKPFSRDTDSYSWPRWTRKIGPSCSKMPVVTVKEKEEDSHKAMKAFYSCFCKEKNPISERLLSRGSTSLTT